MTEIEFPRSPYFFFIVPGLKVQWHDMPGLKVQWHDMPGLKVQWNDIFA